MLLKEYRQTIKLSTKKKAISRNSKSEEERGMRIFIGEEINNVKIYLI
jgi:hypothetical protein